MNAFGRDDENDPKFLCKSIGLLLNTVLDIQALVFYTVLVGYQIGFRY
jgi:hypothetical protein